MTLLPSCHDVQTNLTEYLEGSLPFHRRFGIRVHLLFCRACSGVLRGIQTLPWVAKASLKAPSEAPEAARRALADVQALLRKDPP